MGDRTAGETTGRSTRRDYLTTGLALVGGGILAGCQGGGDGGASTATDTAGSIGVTGTTTATTSTGTAGSTATTRTTSATTVETTTDATRSPDTTDSTTTTAAETDPTTAASTDADSTGSNSKTPETAETTTSTTAEGGSYTVTMEPVGETTFGSVPGSWVATNGSWADMGIALGRDPPTGLITPSRYHTSVYDDIPGVSVDKSEITMLWPEGGLDKELFYAQGADVHVIDPTFVLSRSDWEQRDVAEIRENVGPFFGNSSFTRTYAWHEDYRYYTLYEAFEKLSKVFRAEDRYRAFAELHDEVIGGVRERLPPASERPSVAIVLVTSEQPEEFYPYPMNEGTAYKQWRDLGATSALAEAGVEDYFVSGGTIDYETMLEVDPDALLLWEGTGRFERQSREEFRNGVLAFMEDHEVASQLTAVENGDVYRGGGLYQGPIINLAWTERGAWQLYPDEFERGEQLFDRRRVADIITGEA